MAVTLNDTAYEHAKRLISEGRFVADERDAWSEHQPSTQTKNDFIRQHGFGEYGRWHLGIDDAEPEDSKGHYKFPYGDFRDVHRCGVLSAESRAGQYKHFDVERAAAHLHGMIDAARTAARAQWMTTRTGAVLDNELSRRSVAWWRSALWLVA